MKKITLTLISLLGGIQCCFATLEEGYWAGSMLFNAQKETLNKFLIELGDEDNEYLLSGLFEQWFYAGTNSAEPATIHTIKGIYDEEEGTLSIYPGQVLFNYENGSSVLHVSLISATINTSGKYDLHPDDPIVFIMQNGALTLKGNNAFYLGEMTEGSDYAMGFGYAHNVTLGTVNGVMSFESYETTGWIKSIVSSSMVFDSDNTVTIDNICGLGFGRTIKFIIKDESTIEAENVIYGNLVAAGQPIEVYPCSCDKYGDPQLENGKYMLRGTLTATGMPNNYDVNFGLWGIFDAKGKAYYHFRNTEGNFITSKPHTTVSMLPGNSTLTEEWYTIDGRSVNPANAHHGIYIVKTPDKIIKIIK